MVSTNDNTEKPPKSMKELLKQFETYDSEAEIQLARLLKRCEERVVNQPSFASAIQFTSYLDELHRLMLQLQASPSSELAKVREYSKRINELASHKDIKTRRLTKSQIDRELFEITNLDGKKDNNNNSNDDILIDRKTGPTKRTTKSFDDEDMDKYEEIIRNHRKQQENMTDDMATLARTLKENSQAMNVIINKDNDKLDNVGEAIDTNSGRLGIEHQRLKQHVNSSWSWSLSYWIMLLFVSMIFMGTYIFMKIVPKPSYKDEL